MQKSRLPLAGLALVLSACAGHGTSADATGSTVADPDASIRIALPDGWAPGEPRSAALTCSCLDWTWPCDAAECVSCTGMSAACSECPVPTLEAVPCSTTGLHCDYGERGCDCVADAGSTPTWSCVFWVN